MQVLDETSNGSRRSWNSFLRTSLTSFWDREHEMGLVKVGDWIHWLWMQSTGNFESIISLWESRILDHMDDCSTQRKIYLFITELPSVSTEVKILWTFSYERCILLLFPYENLCSSHLGDFTYWRQLQYLITLIQLYCFIPSGMGNGFSAKISDWDVVTCVTSVVAVTQWAATRGFSSYKCFDVFQFVELI